MVGERFELGKRGMIENRVRPLTLPLSIFYWSKISKCIYERCMRVRLPVRVRIMTYLDGGRSDRDGAATGAVAELGEPRVTRDPFLDEGLVVVA